MVFRIERQPGDVMVTLEQSLTADLSQGCTQALPLISSLEWNDTMRDCSGCTFFIPTDQAVAAVSSLSNFSISEKADILRNHVRRSGET